MRINLYDETISKLRAHDKTESDIRWIGYKSHYIPMLLPLKTLFDYKYDNGYGIECVNQDLLVVGDDWWLERHSYDGSEWWEYKTLPKMPDLSLSLEEGRSSIGDMYFDEDDYE